MRRRSWLSIAMLAVGASLLVAAGYAGPADSKPSSATAAKKGELKRGGTLRVNIAGGDVDHIDPSLAYGTTSWEMEYVTAVKLLNYPDAVAPRGSRLVPEGASRYTVSRNGRVYTFFIRPGFRFSDGRPVTARNYVYAINRALDKELQAPGFQFVSDPAGSNIIGAQDVRDGKAAFARGLRIRGNRLTITLTKADPTFLAKISMPFFQAMSTRLPRGKEVINVSGNALPSAGPYYVASREANRSIVLRRNPRYTGNRPRNLESIAFTAGVNIESGYRQVRAGQADYQLGLPPAEYASLGREFGVNRGRFRVAPSNCVSYMALNNDNPLFRNNVRLRQAVNFAISRTPMVQQYGAYGGTVTDQYLPPGFPGFKPADIYPLARPNLAQAQRLARGNIRTGRGILFHGATPPGPQVAEIVRTDLRRIGINLETRAYRGFAIYDAAGRKGSDHAATVGTGWCQDYPDPYDFINVLLYGGNIQAENNNNLAYFNNPQYNRKMEQAARLLGAARLRTYGELENDITRNQAPWAAWRVPNNRFFLGPRVDPRSFVYQPIYEAPSYGILALR